ncbi:hypothetical protein CRE_20517 [Caenorhabditis remanei]|uniref:Tyrosine-protein phosphatase domain-containing protein n=1 Tax=Caenorhabditis remanei TaxID=31234 RepID=E3N899_CAERE|nr:hypothetical protein CRE_20517 [Caenorhabditis remanei]
MPTLLRTLEKKLFRFSSTMKIRMKEQLVSIRCNQILMILIVHLLLVQVASVISLFDYIFIIRLSKMFFRRQPCSGYGFETSLQLWCSPSIPKRTQLIHKFPDHDPGDFEILGFKLFPSKYFSNRNVRNGKKSHSFYFYNPFTLANEKPAEFLKHTTVVAHIINGISLQTGLLNGNISIDNVVGELLGFGNVQLPAVINFKPDGIIESAKKMKSIRDSIDDNVVAVMTQILDWDRWSVDAGTIESTDFKKLPGVPEYFEEVKKLNAGFNFSVLATAKEESAGLKNSISTFQSRVDSNNLRKTDYAAAALDIGTLQDRFNTFVSAMKLLKEETKKLLRFNRLMGKPDAFKPLRTVTQLMDNRPKLNPIFDDSQVLKLKTSMQNALDSFKDLKTSADDTSLVTELMKSRTQLNVRKYTIGFLNGVSELKKLVDDVRDPWIGKILNLETSQLHVLSDGLQPLIDINDKLSKLDEKLKPVASNKLYESLLNYRDILKDLEGMPADSKDSIDVLEEYGGCKTYAIESVKTTYSPIQNFLTAVDKLKTKLISIIQSMDRIDVDKLSQELTEFTYKLGVSKTDGKPPADDKVPEIIAELKKTDDLQKMQKRFQDFTTMFEGFEGDKLSTEYQKNVTAGESLISETNFLDDIKKEKKVQSCLEKLSDKSTKVFTAVRTLHKMKEVDSGTVSDVESAARAVSEVSKHLTTVNSIPGDMKKNVNNLTEEIDEMPNSATHSEAIGQSVISLKYAYKMKELEMEIGQLKAVGAVVNVELQKIVDPNEKQRIENLWGNHNKDFDDLEKLMTGIKSFDQKLDVSKAGTMADYGGPLKELVTFSDVKMEFNKKAKALRALITQPNIDQKVKSDLENARETLDKLSGLDLQFSSHSAQYTSAPNGFLAVQSFLTKFLSIDRHQKIINKEEADPYVPYYVAAGMLILVIALGVIGYFYYKKRVAKKDATLTAILASIKDYEFRDKFDATVHYKYYIVSLISVFVDYRQGFGWLPLKRHRSSKIPINIASALLTNYDQRNKRIHANECEIFCGNETVTLHLTQGPLEKKMKKKKRIHHDTRGDFWELVLGDGSEYIVMLCDFDEDGKRVCGEYFKKKLNEVIVIRERFEVKTTEVTQLGKTWIRKLEIKDKRKPEQPAHIVTHYQNLTIPSNLAPTEHQEIIDIIRKVKGSTKPVVVHCSTGADRTMSFIGIYEIYSLLKSAAEEKLPTLNSLVTEAFKLRWNCFDMKFGDLMIHWMLLGAVYMLSLVGHQNGMNYSKYNYFQDYKNNILDSKYKKMKEIYKETRKMKLVERGILDNEPIERPRKWWQFWKSGMTADEFNKQMQDCEKKITKFENDEKIRREKAIEEAENAPEPEFEYIPAAPNPDAPNPDAPNPANQNAPNPDAPNPPNAPNPAPPANENAANPPAQPNQ